MLELICLVFAFVLFVIAVFGPAPLARWNLVAAGLAFLTMGAYILPLAGNRL